MTVGSQKLAFAVLGAVAVLFLVTCFAVEIEALKSVTPSQTSNIMLPGVFLHEESHEDAGNSDDALSGAEEEKRVEAQPDTTTAGPKSTTAKAAKTKASLVNASMRGSPTAPPTLVGAGVCSAPSRGKEKKFEVATAGGKKKTIKYCECFPGFAGLRCSIEVLKTKEMAAISLPGSDKSSGAKQHTPISFVKSVDGKTGSWEVISDALEYTIANQDGKMVAVLQPSKQERADLSLNTVVGTEG